MPSMGCLPLWTGHWGSVRSLPIPHCPPPHLPLLICVLLRINRGACPRLPAVAPHQLGLLLVGQAFRIIITLVFADSFTSAAVWCPSCSLLGHFVLYTCSYGRAVLQPIFVYRVHPPRRSFFERVRSKVGR